MVFQTAVHMHLSYLVTSFSQELSLTHSFLYQHLFGDGRSLLPLSITSHSALPCSYSRQRNITVLSLESSC